MRAISAATTFTLEIDGVSSSLWVASFEGEEGMSALFQFRITLASEDADVAPSLAVGKGALLTIETAGSEPRYVHGIIERFRQADAGKRLFTYHAVLVPSLHRLCLRQDSRIYQELSVPQIIEQVLSEAGVHDYRMSVEGIYEPREYCVQYRETDLAFISRLMEEEGIYYFFEHQPGKHVLVMSDGASALGPIPSPASLVYRPPLGAMAHGESVSRIAYMEEIRTGKVSLGDFNFQRPQLSLLSSTGVDQNADLEVYDYPGEYELPGKGAALSKIRLEERQVSRRTGDGESGCARMTPGYQFSLAEHPRDAMNRGYLLTRVQHRGTQPHMGDASVEGTSYANAFQFILDNVPYRPERNTPRPQIHSVQTAIVTGPAGEEIYTDQHGRVKVQFHWDRRGKRDERTSCFIRVSQLWAGAGWGAMFIPRIGHEVVVAFVEGDPDRPLIVGRVYHGANVPPYPLPAEKTKSTIKSDSTIGDGNNEFRFEDKKGSEEIWLHGQKDYNIRIEHDKTQFIGNDEAKHVGHDETHQVDHDRRKVIKHDQLEAIHHDDTIDVGANRRETIGGNESVSIGGNAVRTVSASQTEGVGAVYTLNVGGAMSQSIGGVLNVNVGGAMIENVGVSASTTVGGNASLTAGADYTLSVGRSLNTTVAKDHSESAGADRTITVNNKLTIMVGESVVTLDKDGKITVSGKDITIQGGGTIHVRGKSKVLVKSEGPVQVEASGEVRVKGSAVKMN